MKGIELSTRVTSDQLSFGALACFTPRLRNGSLGLEVSNGTSKCISGFGVVGLGTRSLTKNFTNAVGKDLAKLPRVRSAEVGTEIENFEVAYSNLKGFVDM